MNGLYPIIRRVRRPLLPVDPPADAKPAEAPLKTGQEQVAPLADGLPRKDGDEKPGTVQSDG